MMERMSYSWSKQVPDVIHIFFGNDHFKFTSVDTGRHVWFRHGDFTKAEIARKNKLAVAALVRGEKICKLCGYEQKHNTPTTTCKEHWATKKLVRSVLGLEAFIRKEIDKDTPKILDELAVGEFTCYRCETNTRWLAPDGRCGNCTSYTPEEIRGEV